MEEPFKYFTFELGIQKKVTFYFYFYYKVQIGCNVGLQRSSLLSRWFTTMNSTEILV